MEVATQKYYVYEYFVVSTGEVFYVGKGCGNRYKSLSSRNKFFRDFYRTHDCDVRIVLNGLTEEQAYQEEFNRIQWYRAHTQYRLTNQTDGGDGTRGFKPSEEQKRKIGNTLRQKWQDQKFRSHIIESRHDPDSTFQSAAFKNKISALVTGEKNPNYGNHWTPEMKTALSNKQKQSGRYIGSMNPNAKRIRCVETGEVFEMISDAMQKYHVKHDSSFTVALKHPTRTAAGLHWQYCN